MKDKYIKKAFVSLVGAGPGDLGLVTDKAFKCIKTADVIIYDNLISPSLLNEAGLKAELIYAGKKAAKHHLKQEEINKLLVNKALEGKYVVRLKGGDPFVFGRGAEELEELIKYGIDYEIVCGVSSCISVPAYAGIPLTHRKVSSSFHVITGHEAKISKAGVIDYKYLAKLEGTLCFLMGLENIADISKNLIDSGKAKDTPVSVISNGSLVRQKRVDSTLENISRAVTEENIKSPAIIIVGKVANFHFDKVIKEMEKKPLYGKRILITGTREIVKKLKPLIEKEGGEAVALSLIETVACDEKYYREDIEKSETYSWLVFTSSNGIKTFFEYIQNKGDLIIDRRKLAGIKFAVIGEGSADTLRKYGYIADFVPKEFSGKGLANEWIGLLDKNDRVLILRSKEAGEDIIKALDKAGIYYVDKSLYETIYDYRRKEELQRLVHEVDFITLTSASAAKAFKSMYTEIDKIEADFISIGPITGKIAKELGFNIAATAKKYSASSLIDTIIEEVKR